MCVETKEGRILIKTNGAGQAVMRLIGLPAGTADAAAQLAPVVSSDPPVPPTIQG